VDDAMGSTARRGWGGGIALMSRALALLALLAPLVSSEWPGQGTL